MYMQTDLGKIDLPIDFLSSISTPGPRIMRIQLVQYSTSARSGKNPQIFTYCEFVHLVHTVNESLVILGEVRS